MHVSISNNSLPMNFLSNKWTFFLALEDFNTFEVRHVIEEESMNFSTTSFCGKVSNNLFCFVLLD